MKMSPYLLFSKILCSCFLLLFLMSYCNGEEEAAHPSCQVLPNLRGQTAVEKNLKAILFLNHIELLLKMDEIKTELGSKMDMQLDRFESAINKTWTTINSCLTGFTHVPGVGCLKVVEELKNFEDASNHCSTLSAQLVVPQNFTALLEYVKSLPDSDYDYWVGIRSGRWLDGRDVAQEEWGPGQPNQHVSECGDVYEEGARAYDCGVRDGFICQHH